MAITYPLSTPTTIGIESIELRAVNATSVSQSPFTYKQQTFSYKGQRWEAAINIPTVRRDLAAEWKAMLIALKGFEGTFLLGDPDYVLPRGTLRSTIASPTATITGSSGDSSVTIDMLSNTQTLLAGDYIQLGSGADAKLHTVLINKTGDGTLEIWPSLRNDYSTASVETGSPKGVFRLSKSSSAWSVDNLSTYSISFDAVEAIV